MEKATRGLIGVKVGMTQVWGANNRVAPVTVLRVEPNVVTQVLTKESAGYEALEISSGGIDPRRVSKPRLGHFKKANVNPRRYSVQLRGACSKGLGEELGPDLFASGDRVDVVGVSKGKGFAGVMKRHNFSGVGASHGAHRNHRKPGSIGASATPSRVFKGTRMAGRLGAARVTVLNLTIHSVLVEEGLILIKGAVPGPRGSMVLVRNAVKGA